LKKKLKIAYLLFELLDTLLFTVSV